MRFWAILPELKGTFQRAGWARRVLFRLRLPVRFPLTLTVETTNFCNLDCVSCPQSNRPAGFIDTHLFSRLMDESSAHGQRLMLTLHKDGEPTLHPRLPELVAEAKAKRVARLVTFNSNGVALTPELARRLVLAGLDEVIVSVDASDADGYRSLKGRPAYETVCANVDALMATKRDLGRHNPFTKVQILGTMRALEETVPGFRAHWARRVDGVKVDRFTTWGGAVDESLGSLHTPVHRWPCQYLWYTMAVNWDGIVSRCVYDWRVDEPVGDARNESLGDIWGGERFCAIREAHLSGEYPGVCASCTNWAETDDMGRSLRRVGSSWR